MFFIQIKKTCHAHFQRHFTIVETIRIFIGINAATVSNSNLKGNLAIQETMHLSKAKNSGRYQNKAK
jgi:hypothetical protein